MRTYWPKICIWDKKQWLHCILYTNNCSGLTSLSKTPFYVGFTWKKVFISYFVCKVSVFFHQDQDEYFCLVRYQINTQWNAVHQPACLNAERPLNKSWICSGLQLTARKKKDSFPFPLRHCMDFWTLRTATDRIFTSRAPRNFWHAHYTLVLPLILIISAGVARVNADTLPVSIAS